MNPLTSLWELPRCDRWSFYKALCVVAAIRLSLSIVPFAMLRRRLKGLIRVPLRKPIEAGELRRMAWAVRTASRRIPRASCLTQALSLQILLSDVGCPTELRIGMAKSSAGIFEAHAWLEMEGRVLIGRVPDLARYQAVLQLKEGQL
jgi:hypothetical protein